MNTPSEIPVAHNGRSPILTDHLVGDCIRSLRRGQGRTQRDLAQAVGVTGAQLHRYEAGTTRIAASRLIAIANALGVEAEVLIAAGKKSAETAPQAVAETTAQVSDAIVELAELVELYSSMTDPRHRTALITIARTIKRAIQPLAQP